MLNINLGDADANELAYATICDVMEFYGLDFSIDIELVGRDDIPANDSEAGCLMVSDGNYAVYINDKTEWTMEKIVECVAHEMVHIKQHELDGFDLEIQGRSHTATFQGKHYRMDNLYEYWLSPWEMEARAMEKFFLMRMALKKWL
jgi:hypothetical protein